MKKFLAAICLLLCLGAGADAADNEAESGTTRPGAEIQTLMEYQALGRSFVLPLIADVGLIALDGAKTNDPAWQLLAAAWNQPRLLPYEVMVSGNEGEVNIYLAVMGSQANGRNITAPVEDKADFIAGQFWAEYDNNMDIASLAPDKASGLGVFARNDESIYALSAWRMPEHPQARQSDNPVEMLQAMMVSSVSVVNGIPVMVGVATNAPSVVGAEHLFNICNNITLYLALTNHMPASGFFNPDMDNLVIAGRRLKLALPPDSCLLKASTPRQAVALIQWERFYAATHNLIAAYAPCDKLAQWQEGPENAHLAYYGLLAVNLYDGQLQLVDNAREFAGNLRQEQQGEALTAARLDALDRQEVIRQMPAGAVEVLGHMGMERNVGYWPVMLRVFDNDPQASGVLAGVLGVGAVNGLAITSALYMPIEHDKVYTTLLKRQKALFASFK